LEAELLRAMRVVTVTTVPTPPADPDVVIATRIAPSTDAE
jgi:hypothetical protein